MTSLDKTPKNVAGSVLVLAILIAVSSFLPGGNNPIPGRRGRAYCPAAVSVTRIAAGEGGRS